jgi:hypothetical protein
MGNGNDRINMGAGNDNFGFAFGDDLLDMSGGHGYITWGLFPGWPSPASAVNYISCDTPDLGDDPFDTAMEIRSDHIVITSNTGDVIIQLGAAQGTQSLMSGGGEQSLMGGEPGPAWVSPDGLDDYIIPNEIQ